MALLGGALSLFALSTWLVPVDEGTSSNLNLSVSNSVADVPVITYHDRAKVRSTSANILSASPFNQDRSAFRKSDTGQSLSAPIVQPIEAPNPNFIGTVGSLNDVEAIIIWNAGLAPQRIRLGSATPAGEVTRISRNSVTFVDVAGRETVLHMFED
jgi:hypothetical protein